MQSRDLQAPGRGTPGLERAGTRPAPPGRGEGRDGLRAAARCPPWREGEEGRCPGTCPEGDGTDGPGWSEPAGGGAGATTTGVFPRQVCCNCNVNAGPGGGFTCPQTRPEVLAPSSLVVKLWPSLLCLLSCYGREKPAGASPARGGVSSWAVGPSPRPRGAANRPGPLPCSRPSPGPAAVVLESPQTLGFLCAQQTALLAWCPAPCQRRRAQAAPEQSPRAASPGTAWTRGKRSRLRCALHDAPVPRAEPGPRGRPKGDAGPGCWVLPPGKGGRAPDSPRGQARPPRQPGLTLRGRCWGSLPVPQPPGQLVGWELPGAAPLRGAGQSSPSASIPGPKRSQRAPCLGRACR